jgi:DNA gyrase subunit B
MMNANDEMTTHPSPDRPFLIDVTLFADRKTVSVTDYGRGIKLTDKHNGVPLHELLFETLFAGTNFDNAESGKETTGTNGCGLTVLNHTCDSFICRSVVDNVLYVTEYSNGGLHKEVSENATNYDIINGSTFIFSLDPGVYTQTTFSVEVIKEMCNHLAGVSNGLTITFRNIVEEEEVFTYHYSDTADYMSKNCASSIGKQYEFDERTESEEIVTRGMDDTDIHTGSFENNRMKLVWSIGTDPFQESYLNCTYLREGGTIYDGVIEGFRKVLDKYSDKKVKITAADIELGLNFVCGLWTNNVEFANQTKFSTKKTSYKKHIVKYVSDNLEAFRLENSKEFDEILKHFVEINNFNKKAEDDIKQLKSKIQKKTRGGLSPKIEGLLDCDMRNSNVEERMLFIDEGKSANHTLISARDPRIMGCIGLRGRFINSLKTSAANVFKNEEAMAIMGALGCGIELPEKERKRLKGIVEFNADELRYGKAICAADQDAFGRAIDLSLLCFFYKFYPTLCEQGRIYLASSPRYVIQDKKGNEYCAYNDTEKETIVKDLGKNFASLGIIKGLGELDAERFWKYVLSPEAREKSLVQVDWDAYKPELEELLQTTMGEKIEERKKFIIDNVVNV